MTDKSHKLNISKAQLQIHKLVIYLAWIFIDVADRKAHIILSTFPSGRYFIGVSHVSNIHFTYTKVRHSQDVGLISLQIRNDKDDLWRLTGFFTF